jgi:hypothetical protein
MWQYLYKVFTTNQGVYICYLLPIVYFMAILLEVISSKIRRHDHIGGKDIIAAVAILLIFVDFVDICIFS